MLTHDLIALDTTTPTILTVEGRETGTSMTVSIQNTSSTAAVFIGDSTVSSSNYGLRLLPGAQVSIDDLSMAVEVYAVSSAPATSVAVIRVTR